MTVGRAEIDTRAPFRSVKEAVVLFGEKVLVGELHAGRRITQTQNREAAAPKPCVKYQAVAPTASILAAARPVPVPMPMLMPAPVAKTTRELDAAKQELEKEREEKHKMAGCIQSLQDELSSAMSELKKLKAAAARHEEEPKAVIDLQVEDLKFMEIEDKQQQQPPSAAAEFQKKRYVTFADPPAASPPLPDVVLELHHPHQQQQYYTPAGRPQYREVRFSRQVSAGPEAVKKLAAAAVVAEEEGRKKKKKPLIPLVGALFMRKKKTSGSSGSGGHQDGGSSAAKPRPSF